RPRPHARPGDRGRGDRARQPARRAAARELRPGPGLPLLRCPPLRRGRATPARGQRPAPADPVELTMEADRRTRGWGPVPVALALTTVGAMAVGAAAPSAVSADLAFGSGYVTCAVLVWVGVRRRPPE